MYSPRSCLNSEGNQSEIATMDSEISDLKFEISKLSLRELESLARALLSVLLAFLDPRIARDQSRVLQCRPQVAIVLNQSSCDSVANRAGLACRSAAGDVDEHDELVCRLRQLHRLTNDHPQRLVRKVYVERSAIDLEVAPAGSQVDSRRCALASSSSVVFNLCHVLILLCFLFCVLAGRQFEGLRSLRRVRVIGARVNFEFLSHRFPEFVLG